MSNITFSVLSVCLGSILCVLAIASAMNGCRTVWQLFAHVFGAIIIFALLLCLAWSGINSPQRSSNRTTDYEVHGSE